MGIRKAANDQLLVCVCERVYKIADERAREVGVRGWGDSAQQPSPWRCVLPPA